MGCMSSRHLTRDWVVTPEDDTVQWTAEEEGPNGLYASVSPTVRENVTTADYDVPHTQVRWDWTVDSLYDGRTLAEGSEDSEKSAKRAAEERLDTLLSGTNA